jgi:hypothetical protein
MDIRHPLEWIPETEQKAAFWILFAATIIMIIFMQIVSAPLITDAAPQGIVSFEFSGNLPNAEKIINSWGQEERIYAGLSLGLDYLFLVLYSSTIALGCMLTARTMSAEFLITTGAVLAWAQFAAAFLDCVENFALIKLLLGSCNAVWPQIAFWCAGPKFFIVGVGLVYIIIGAVVLLIRRSH